MRTDQSNAKSTTPVAVLLFDLGRFSVLLRIQLPLLTAIPDWPDVNDAVSWPAPQIVRAWPEFFTNDAVP